MRNQVRAASLFVVQHIDDLGWTTARVAQHLGFTSGYVRQSLLPKGRRLRALAEMRGRARARSEDAGEEADAQAGVIAS